MSTRPIVFLDCETNGLHADRRPWEIAWIRREVDGTETERCIQIADVDNTHAELKGLQVGRFHERWKGGPKVVDDLISAMSFLGEVPEGENMRLEADAAREVERATRDAIIVGAVPSFDTEVLAAMLRRHKLCPSWYYNLVDVETLATGWLHALPASAPIVQRRKAALQNQLLDEHTRDRIYANPDYGKDEHASINTRVMEAAVEVDEVEKELAAVLRPDCRSDDLSRACGVEPPAEDERHTALGDARWVKRWYDHIVGGAA